MPPARLRSRSTALPAAVIKAGLAMAALLAPGMIMAEECPLATPLILRDLQSGFAGETGTVWTIAPDCSFTIARQIGQKVLDAHKEGRLSAAQQVALKDMLGHMSKAALPKHLGGAPQPNARRLTFSYGGNEAALTLPPGGGGTDRLRDAADAGLTKTFLDLATKMKQMLGS